MTRPHRWITTLSLCLLAGLVQTGCSTAAQAVDPVHISGQQRDFDKQTGILRKHMQDLQARGDPLGDYYYALANSDGWIHDVTDPKAITALFEKAAAKLTGCLEVQLVTGEFDYFVKLRIQGIDSFNDMHSAQLIALPGVRQVRTFVCLKEVFETTVLPV